MTNFTYVDDQITNEVTAVTLPGPGDAALIVAGVTVASYNEVSLLTTGILFGNSVQQVFLDGTAFARYGVRSTGTQSILHIGETGAAYGASIGAWFAAAGAKVTNEGTIGGLSALALDLGGFVLNSGSIQGTTTGIVSFNPGFTIDVLPLRVQNTGLISGDFAILADLLNDSVVNAGTIVGQVVMSDGDDLVDTSAGRILGTVSLGNGNDTAIGGAGNDDIRDGRGADEIDTGAGDDRVTLEIDQASDTVDGGTGEDLLRFDAEESVNLRVNLVTGLVQGAGDADFISGFERVRIGTGGDNTVTGDNAANRIWGGNGNDTLLGGGGDDRLFGGFGANRLEGGDGHDRLTGGEARDTIVGGAGNDTITGSYDIDNLTGGSGADLFIWRDVNELFVISGGTFDRITDFDTNGDIIDLSGIDPDGVGGDNVFTFVGSGPITAAGQVAVRQAGGNTFVDISWQTAGVASSVRLDGLVTLDANDFVL